MVSSLHELFEKELQDLYSAEKQITKALPKMVKAAQSDELKQAFETHLKQTEKQIERLEEIGRSLELKLTGTKCKGMEGVIAEGDEMAKMKMEPVIKDMALITAAQRVEHYEIAGYGTAVVYAKAMEHTDAVDLLQETLDEESETDELLTDISESMMKMAPMGMEDE